MTNNSKFMAAMPLFLAIFLDGVGLGIIFPVLGAIMIDPHASILPAATTDVMRNFYYGLVISVFMAAWFFGSAILGDLSDMIGRKKSLMVCLIGSAIGFVLSAIAVVTHSYWLLVIGRIIDGFTAGSQPIAQAAVIDMSAPQDKTRYLGYILFAASCGFIFGPLFGGFLSDATLISWFGFAMPFYFAAVMALLNVVLVAWMYHEPEVLRRQVKINLYHAVELFSSAFKHAGVRNLSVILMLMMVGWSSYYTFISLFLLGKFNFTPTMISEYLALGAVGFGIGTGYLINMLLKYMTQRNVAILGLLMAALGIFINVTTTTPVILWSVVVFVCTGIALTYVALLGLFSEQVSETEQGWVMGITGSIGAFAFAVTGFIEAFMSSLSVSAPMMSAAILLVMTALFAMVTASKRVTVSA